MDASAITAIAGLVGAAIGGLTSQRTQARAQWLARDIVRRQDLYKEFIADASKCYVHALQHEEADIPTLVELYAKLGRMRLLSSPNVLESASNEESSIRIWRPTRPSLSFGR
jgi:hypothetical protein